MIRVIKPGLRPTIDTWRAKTTCYVCRAELEFGAGDIASSSNQKNGTIKCPECGYMIEVSQPPLSHLKDVDQVGR